MEKQIRLVTQFHESFGEVNGKSPSLVEENVYELRHRLMHEENEEYIEACKTQNLEEIADALGDQLYVLIGTILKHGLQYKIEEVFDEIHRSNMSKLSPCPMDTNEDGDCGASNCYTDHRRPILREDGKIMKGKCFSKPNIKKIIYGKRNTYGK